MLIVALIMDLITGFILATFMLGGFTYFLEEIIGRRKLTGFEWFCIIVWGLTIFSQLALRTLGGV